MLLWQLLALCWLYVSACAGLACVNVGCKHATTSTAKHGVHTLTFATYQLTSSRRWQGRCAEQEQIVLHTECHVCNTMAVGVAQGSKAMSDDSRAKTKERATWRLAPRLNGCSAPQLVTRNRGARSQGGAKAPQGGNISWFQYWLADRTVAPYGSLAAGVSLYCESPFTYNQIIEASTARSSTLQPPHAMTSSPDSLPRLKTPRCKNPTPLKLAQASCFPLDQNTCGL